MAVKVRRRPDRVNLQLVYTNPVTNQQKTKSAKTPDWDMAQRAAHAWELELGDVSGRAVTWPEMRLRFETEHLNRKAPATVRAYTVSLDKFERLMGRPTNINDIDSSLLSQYKARLFAEPDLSDSTVARSLRELQVCLNWAVEVGLMKIAPKVRKPAVSGSKGRPLSRGEFIRMLRAVKLVIPPDYVGDWQNALKAIWLTGLRISELVDLHWTGGEVRLDMETTDYPRFVFAAGGQKNKKNQIIPLTPDAARFFRRLGPGDGYVLHLPTERTARVTADHAGRLIGDIGRFAGIKTGTRTCASAHDLRRTFGNRWALKLHPIVLKTLMRHVDIKTTLKFYVDINADQIARQLATDPNQMFNPIGF